MNAYESLMPVQRATLCSEIERLHTRLLPLFGLRSWTHHLLAHFLQNRWNPP